MHRLKGQVGEKIFAPSYFVVPSTLVLLPESIDHAAHDSLGDICAVSFHGRGSLTKILFDLKLSSKVWAIIFHFTDIFTPEI